MRLLIDGVAFENDHQRGVQRYFRELLTRVAKIYPVDIFMSSPIKAEMPVGCSITYRRERFGSHRLNIPLRAFRKLKRRISPTRFSGHTLFHSSFFTRSPEPGLPELVTVYDMIPERFESRFHAWGQGHIDKKRQCMEAAQRIVCISHATAADVAKIYPHLAGKLCAVHLGADHFLNQTIEQSPAPRNGSAPYLLQVGDRHSYKNFGVVLLAMKEPAWPKQLHVTVAGPPPATHELETVRKLNLESRVTFVGRVSEKQLPDLYRKSAGFVFPSLCEGFGFPLLEAQSMGTPVICSDIAAFHETAGGATLFFDPENPASLAAKTVELLNGAAADNREAGLKNIGRFRWEECARLTLDIYQSLSKEVVA